ncbi:MAG: hypothetical protein AAF491_12355, partial [Verrucomicrobiota bacterium]
MNFLLQLTSAESASDRPVSAGWLPGDDAAAWLEELTRNEAKGIPLHLFSVGKSVATPECAGALLVPKRAGERPIFSGRVMPLQKAIEGVFIPMGSQLSALLLNEERRQLFPHETHMIHPILGMVGFSSEEAIDPSSLLVFPPIETGNWNAGLPGPAGSPPFTGIVIPPPPPSDDLIQQAGSDISSKFGDLSKLDRGLGGKLGNLGKGLAGGAILGLSGLAGSLGKAFGISPDDSASEKNDHIRDWAKRNWEGLFDERKREIDRLLEKMKSDPDAGLRYALPLTGTGASRGVARPSSRLGPRSLRFSTGGGGGPADNWDIEWEQRLALEKQYRDAAAREIKRGN